MARRPFKSFLPTTQIPTNQIVDTFGRSAMGEALEAGVQGGIQGFNTGETIRKLRNRIKATQILSQQPELVGLQQGIPPEFLEAAIENPALLSTLTKRQGTRSPFVSNEQGEIQASPGQELSADEAFLLLQQKRLSEQQSKVSPSANSSKPTKTVSDSDALQWLKTNYPNSTGTVEDIEWAKERLRGRR